MKQNIKYENYLAVRLTKSPELKGFSTYMSDISIRANYNYVMIIDRFVQFTGKAITEIAFDDYVNFLNKSKKTEDGRNSVPGTQTMTYAALKKFSHYLYVSKKASEDYMESVNRPKAYETQSTIAKREKGYLTETEIKKVLTQFIHPTLWEDYRDYAIIALMLNTGIRRMALTQIDIADYDRENNSIAVTDKGDKVRVFILSNSMCEILDNWIEQRNKIVNANGALFITKRKNSRNLERIKDSDVYRIVRKYTTCVEGKTISPHKLRATYGTQLYNKTHDIYFVQTCMGHNSPTTTERYVRGKENRTRDASELLESLYS